VVQEDDGEWIKKCMDFVVEGALPRGRPKRTWMRYWRKYEKFEGK